MKIPAPLRVALLVLLCDMLCQSLVYPSMPTLIREIGGLDAQDAALVYGGMAASYAVAELFAAPVLGAMADRFGRRPILLLSVFGGAVSFAISAVAPSLTLLVLGYFLAGLTSAMRVVVNAMVADVTDEAGRARGFSLVGATFGVGFALGPALGAAIGQLGLRAPFYAAAIVMTAVGLVAVGTLRESLPPEKRARKLDRRQLLFWRALAGLAGRPFVRGLLPTIVLNALALQMLIGVWVPYGEYRYRFGVLENGLVLAAFGLTAAVAQATFIPWAIERLGTVRAVAVGWIFSAVGYAGYGLAPTAPWFVGVTVAQTFGAIDEPALQSALSTSIPEDEQGAVQGALATAAGIMGIFGPLLGTALFRFTSGPRAAVELPGSAFLLGGALTAVGGVLAVRHLRRQAPSPA